MTSENDTALHVCDMCKHSKDKGIAFSFLGYDAMTFENFICKDCIIKAWQEFKCTPLFFPFKIACKEAVAFIESRIDALGK
jgi:hypothetical protein